MPPDSVSALRCHFARRAACAADAADDAALPPRVFDAAIRRCFISFALIAADVPLRAAAFAEFQQLAAATRIAAVFADAISRFAACRRRYSGMRSRHAARCQMPPPPPSPPQIAAMPCHFSAPLPPPPPSPAAAFMPPHADFRFFARHFFRRRLRAAVCRFYAARLFRHARRRLILPATLFCRVDDIAAAAIDIFSRASPPPPAEPAASRERAADSRLVFARRCPPRHAAFMALMLMLRATPSIALRRCRAPFRLPDVDFAAPVRRRLHAAMRLSLDFRFSTL